MNTNKNSKSGYKRLVKKIKKYVDRLYERTVVDDTSKVGKSSSSNKSNNNATKTAKSISIQEHKEKTVNTVNIVSTEIKAVEPINSEINLSDEWHKRKTENQETLMQMVKSMDEMRKNMESIQADMNAANQKMICYSDNITEEFSFRFYEALISFYDDISEFYKYHKEKADESDLDDYKDCAENYQEFLYTIEEIFAKFGIKKISSSTGDSFDGAIHKATVNEFDPRASVVDESIKAGFIYGETILRKEIVSVKNN